MRLFLSFTRLWVLAVPFALTIVGAGMNQAVLISNHDKFPVMMNEQRIAANDVDDSGLMDVEGHCIMTADTHLNWLADYIDLKQAIYSPGDILLELGDYLTPFAPFVWGLFLLTDKLRGA